MTGWCWPLAPGVARPAASLPTRVSGVEEIAHARRMPGACASCALSGGRAVVVGGGLLGLEAAHGLNSLGFRTDAWCIVGAT